MPNQKKRENHDDKIPKRAIINPPDFPRNRPKKPKYIEVINGINNEIKCIFRVEKK